TEQLGKPSGSDEKLQKSTFPALLGLEQSQQRARQLCEQAQQALAGYGPRALPLQQLAQYIITRNH
ncbi:MAG: geranyl transferase, partial [Alcanivorax sp.]